MAFSQTFFLLDQECDLIEGSLGVGLTSLIKARVDNKGECYAAFFNLAIALERLMKMAIVLDHMADNNLASPSTKDMKAFGHDLMSLYGKIAELATKKSIHPFVQLEQGSTGLTILQFLSEFASVARYANFDKLVGKSQVIDPLVRWSLILRLVIDTEVSERQKNSARSVATNVAEVMKDFTRVNLHDLEKRPMSLEDSFAVPKLHALAASHIVWHLIQLIASIRQVVAGSARNAANAGQTKDPNCMHIPDMTEFITFAWPNRAWVMKKRRWP
jgi:hypothetical protein